MNALAASKNASEDRPSRTCLVISNVPIGGNPESPGIDTPCPDYLILRDALRPEIVDVKTIFESRNPLIHSLAKRVGNHWIVAGSAVFRSRNHGVVLATGEDVGFPYAVLARVFRRGQPLIVICHNVSTRRPTHYLHRLKVGSMIDRFLCLSETQAKILESRYNIPRQRIEVIHWFVDDHFFQPDRSIPIRHQICSAGMANRDYATLVEAVRGLDVDVKIAADSPWFRQAPNVSPSALPGNVEMRSYGTYRALRRLYAESRFVVVPLRDVQYSAGYTVILEAMAMGKAVIVSQIGQKDEFVIEGWNGFRVIPGKPAELRERICYLLAHPGEAERMGANGRKMVEERFALRHYGDTLRHAMDEVLGQN